MATTSSIEWTQATWNPVVGCSKVIPGCAYCYSERMSCRLAGMARHHPDCRDRRAHHLKVINARGHWNNKVSLVEEALEDPLHWKTPLLIFVNSMSDLFHKDVPLPYIQSVFTVMALCPEHTFQVLTKRPYRLLELSPQL